MAAVKQTKGAILTWALVDLAFIAIIIVLMFELTGKNKSDSTAQIRERMLRQLSERTVVFDRAMTEADTAGNVFAAITKAEGDSVSEKQLAAIKDGTGFSHAFIFDGDTLITADAGLSDVSDKLTLTDFTGAEDTPLYAVLDTDGYADVEAFAVLKPVPDSSKSILFTVSAEELEATLPDFVYGEYVFICLTSEEGKVLCSFSKYRDTDSVFLKDANLIEKISGNSKIDDYSEFWVKFRAKEACTVKAGIGSDSRTFVFVPVGDSGIFLTMGVRQFYFDDVVSRQNTKNRGMVIRLSVVIIMFALFAFGTLISATLKSRERGRELENKADTDLLTDLYNKLATERKIQEYIDDNPRGRALMFVLDVDNFKKINDTMGHAFGDTMLKTLGKEIRSVFRFSDIIGRIGGDEFIVFLKDVKNDAEVKEEADRLVRFFHDFKAGGDYVKYSATASIGAAVYPDDAKSFKALYETADQALYKAKKRGKNRLVFYNEELYQGSE